MSFITLFFDFPVKYLKSLSPDNLRIFSPFLRIIKSSRPYGFEM